MPRAKIIELQQQQTLNMIKKTKKKKLNIPLQVLWGKKGIIGKQFKPIKIWQKYSNKKVLGFEINSGHFIPEQNPKETIKQLKNFFLKYV